MRNLPLVHSTILLSLLVALFAVSRAQAQVRVDLQDLMHPPQRIFKTLESSASAVSLEEQERSLLNGNDPAKLSEVMLKIAVNYISLKEYEKAEEKWMAALAKMQDLVFDDRDPAVHKCVMASLRRIHDRRRLVYERYYYNGLGLTRSKFAANLLPVARSFELAGQLQRDGKVLVAAYEFSLASDEFGLRAKIDADILARLFRESGDTESGAKLFNRLIGVAQKYRGARSQEVGSWQIRLADYFAESGQTKRTKQVCAEFMRTLDSIPLPPSKPMLDDMASDVYYLQKNGFKVEAGRVDRKLAHMRRLEAACKSRTTVTQKRSHTSSK